MTMEFDDPCNVLYASATRSIDDIITEINNLYNGPYNAFVREVTHDYTMTNPPPMSFFRRNETLQRLYNEAIYNIWNSTHDYNELIKFLKRFEEKWPIGEWGRDLYFSSAVIKSITDKSLRHIVVNAFIAGAVKNIFEYDVVADCDGQNIETIYKQLKEYSDTYPSSVYLLCALRYARYPKRYTTEGKPPIDKWKAEMIKESKEALTHPEIAQWIPLSKEFAKKEDCTDIDANEIVKRMSIVALSVV